MVKKEEVEQDDEVNISAKGMYLYEQFYVSVRIFTIESSEVKRKSVYRVSRWTYSLRVYFRFQTSIL